MQRGGDAGLNQHRRHAGSLSALPQALRRD
jgi:hypothetical protein